MLKVSFRLAMALAVAAFAVTADAKGAAPGGGHAAGGAPHAAGGFHGGSAGGFHGGSVGGFRGGSVGGFRGGSVGHSFAVRSGGVGRSFAIRSGGARSFHAAGAHSFRGRMYSGRGGSRLGVARSYADRHGLRSSHVSRLSSRSAWRRSAQFRAAHVRSLRAANLRSANLRTANQHSANLAASHGLAAGHMRPFHRHFFRRFAFRGAFIGWYGPLFWPYAYDDIFYDAFWPYEDEDPFWYYGYPDLYAGIFSPYGYDDLVGMVPPRTHVAGAAREGGRTGGREPTRNAALTGRLGQMCGEDRTDIAGLPIDQIQQAVAPDDAQRAALDDLANASVKAGQIIKVTCPADIALTPTGRLDSMEQRLAAMAQAVQTVLPPLDRFYASISDEQKARLNAIGAGESRRDEGEQRPGLARPCGEVPAGMGNWPSAEIERAVKPTPDQRASLDALKAAATQAAQTIKASCPAQPPATPPARLAAIAARIDAMAAAVTSVRSALDTFYGSLSDEQKARFNAIGRTQAGRSQG